VTNIIIIPARGGSKGIPRKNLRPVGGFPLIYYSITAALGFSANARVVVSTDDDEIALFSTRFGAEVILRTAHLADDKTTLDPVIFDAVKQCEKKYNEQYGCIITVQPTSPLVNSSDIDGVYQEITQNGYDSVLTVVDDRHLCWTEKNGKATPTYSARVNRQQLPKNYKETGAVIACTGLQLKTGTRIGRNVGVYEVPYERSFDIDNFADLYVCEAMLKRKKIVFTVVGYAEVGLGHAFRAVMLAHELVQYDLQFVCEAKSSLAIDYIRSHHYDVIISTNGIMAETVISLNPDLVINDILDTSLEYMNKLSSNSLKIVNFEDMGSGYENADLVINALYPHQLPQKNVLVGPKYFCLRDEFLYIGSHQRSESVKNVLITFGGVDEGDVTKKVLLEIAETCQQYQLSIEIIVGPGYKYYQGLKQILDGYVDLDCTLIKHTKKMSEHMIKADIALTSGGRTVLELASLKVPTIVICQNERETTHTFASSENGIVNLGHRKYLAEQQIREIFIKIISDSELRAIMAAKVEKLDLTKGKERVISKIKSLLH
jgi:CMP-N-acetylneuraminic acid synthetase/spore coat polysaccharide biosynthesis predicted glycosyltransferase SpsG